jgi:hypothetical protein
MKSHLISSESPLLEGQNYVALCGKVVPRATWVFFAVDPSRMEPFLASFNPIRDCSKCWFGKIPSGLVYGMVPGEEMERVRAKGEDV